MLLCLTRSKHIGFYCKTLFCLARARLLSANIDVWSFCHGRSISYRWLSVILHQFQFIQPTFLFDFRLPDLRRTPVFRLLCIYEFLGTVCTSIVTPFSGFVRCKTTRQVSRNTCVKRAVFTFEYINEVHNIYLLYVLVRPVSRKIHLAVSTRAILTTIHTAIKPSH